jgi:hypothetical protein
MGARVKLAEEHRLAQSHFVSPCTLFFETGFFTEPGARIATSKSQLSRVFPWIGGGYRCLWSGFICGCWDPNSEPHTCTLNTLKPALLLFKANLSGTFKKINYYLFYVYEYTIAIFRHTRRGNWIPLQMVVSHHVVAGN